MIIEASYHDHRSFVSWSSKLRILVIEASYPGHRSFVSWSSKLRILVIEASYHDHRSFVEKKRGFIEKSKVLAGVLPLKQRAKAAR
jgi:hypothetical protein